MIWQTWRQHRAEASVAVAIVAVLAVALVVVGSVARNRADHLGLPACADSGKECGAVLEALHRDFHTMPPFTGALVALPLLAGMFFAAPLVSREYEAGTHRLAWTQSVSPLRWISTKVVLVFGVLAVAALGLGLLAVWALDPLAPAFGGRYNSSWYDIQGIVPVACMVFALAFGAALSALTRHTIPAMAATLVGYAAARIPVHFFRGHLLPVTTHTVTVPVSTLLQSLGGSPRDLAASQLSPDDWLQSVTLTDATGRSIDAGNGTLGVLQHYCPALPTRVDPSAADLQSCRVTVQGMSLHETISYQPAGRFWAIQAVECGIFLAVAAVFVAVAVIAVTRRRPS